MSDIDRLIPRLKCLLFTHKYPHLIKESKKALKVAIRAYKEVKESERFLKLLEYILLVGNIMNSGSCKAKAAGFDFSYLPKVLKLMFIVLNCVFIFLASKHKGS